MDPGVHTSGYVKLLLPPRQSRGISFIGLGRVCAYSAKRAGDDTAGGSTIAGRSSPSFAMTRVGPLV